MNDVNTVVSKAVRAEQIRDYRLSLRLYQKAIGMLLEQFQEQRHSSNNNNNNNNDNTNNNNKKRREKLKNRTTELLHRAEQIQRYLHSKEQPKESNKTIHQNDNNNNSNTKSKNEPLKEKEWSFNLSLDFHVKSKINETGPIDDHTKQDNDNKGSSYLIKILQLLGR